MSEPGTETGAEESPVLQRKGGLWSAIAVLLIGGMLLVWIARNWPTGNGDTPSPETSTEQQAPRHLIFISIDTLRADHLHCYGYERETSPAIDALAREGILFERHYTCYPLTLPAHLTQLTGVSSLGHRVRDNLYHSLPAQIATLPERLSAQGFTCGAFVSAHTMKSGSGIERGFSIYDDRGVRELEPGRLTIRERKAPETLGAAGDWLAENRGKDRLFCFVHLFDPHIPYEPPADLRGKFGQTSVDLYDAEIAGVDRELARFVARLGELELLENSLLVITADHGEGLGDHNELSHGYFCYDATTHVPLILRGAGVQDLRLPWVTRNYDLAPTLLELLGVADEAFARQFHGVSLAQNLRKPEADPGLSAYIESHYAWLNAGWAKIRGLRTQDGLTLFAGGEAEFYLDSAQTQNVADRQRTEVAAAREEITRLLGSLLPPRGEAMGGAGHAAAGSPYPGEAPTIQEFAPESLNDTRDKPSPMDRSGLLRRFQEAELAYDNERFELCRATLQELLVEDGDFLMALRLLATVDRLLVERESAALGLADATERTREAAECLVKIADLERVRRQPEAEISARRAAALLAAWLIDGDLFARATGDSEDPSLRWLSALLDYRAATDAAARQAALADAEPVAAQLPEEVAKTAQAHLDAMRSGEAIKLAPWE